MKLEHGTLYTRKQRWLGEDMWHVHLGDMEVAIMVRKSSRWVPKNTTWEFFRVGLVGKGVYNSSVIRGMLDRLAMLVNNANMRYGKNFTIDLAQGSLRQWKNVRDMFGSMGLTMPEPVVCQAYLDFRKRVIEPYLAKKAARKAEANSLV